MRQTVDTTSIGDHADNGNQADLRRVPARQPRKLYITSAILFAVALALMAFSSWYSSGSITTVIPVSSPTWTEDQGTALSHPTGGIVSQVLVREGQKVKAGDTLLVLEDGNITAPTDGAIIGLKIRAPGEMIRPGAKVMAIVPMAVLALET